MQGMCLQHTLEGSLVGFEPDPSHQTLKLMILHINITVLVNTTICAEFQKYLVTWGTWGAHSVEYLTILGQVLISGL